VFGIKAAAVSRSAEPPATGAQPTGAMAQRTVAIVKKRAWCLSSELHEINK